jgi:type I restriction enzyme, S subunit
VLKVGCVNRDTFDPGQNKCLPTSLQPLPSLEIRDGDVLVSRAYTQQLLGLAALAVRPRGKLLLCDKLFRFRALPDVVDARYLVYAIRSRPSRAQIESSTNGASDSMQNIGQNVIRNLWTALPPLIEQGEIVESIAASTHVLAAGIEQTQREIDLIHEYRARLIADVVTGKLDVRAAAASLISEVTDPEAGDDTELLDGEDAVEDEVAAEMEEVEV